MSEEVTYPCVVIVPKSLRVDKYDRDVFEAEQRAEAVKLWHRVLELLNVIQAAPKGQPVEDCLLLNLSAKDVLRPERTKLPKQDDIYVQLQDLQAVVLQCKEVLQECVGELEIYAHIAKPPNKRRAQRVLRQAENLAAGRCVSHGMATGGKNYVKKRNRRR